MVPASPWELGPGMGLGGARASSGRWWPVGGSSLCCLMLGEEPESQAPGTLAVTSLVLEGEAWWCPRAPVQG